MSKQFAVDFIEASREETSALLEFLNTVTEETDFILHTVSNQLSLPEMETFIENTLITKNCICLIAKLKNKVIGLITIISQSDIEIEHIGDLFIAVQKDYWGYGIGHILMEEAIEWASDNDITRRLELSVQGRNERAIHLYQKFSFEIDGLQTRGIKRENGEFLDIYRMSKLID